MSKLTIICVLLALAHFAKAEHFEPELFVDEVAEEEIAERSPDEKSPEPSEAEGKAPEDSAPKEGEVMPDAAPIDAAQEDDFSDPFGFTPYALSLEDIMKMRSDPSTGTVVSGFSSSKSSSMKMVDGVLVEDNKNEQTIINDGNTVSVTNST